MCVHMTINVFIATCVAFAILVLDRLGTLCLVVIIQLYSAVEVSGTVLRCFLYDVHVAKTVLLLTLYSSSFFWYRK